MMTGGGLYGGFGFENKGFRFFRPSEGSACGFWSNCNEGKVITGMAVYGWTFDKNISTDWQDHLTKPSYKDTHSTTREALEQVTRTSIQGQNMDMVMSSAISGTA